MIVCLVLNIICCYTLIYVRSCARKAPQNYTLLFLFTITESYLVTCTTSFYDPQTILIAAILTASITIALTIYACTTKTDFTICGGLFFVLGMVLFVGCLLSLFFRNRIFQIIICCFSVVLYSLYLIYDTQLILGNKENKLQIDDYIFAAMSLYIDIIQIFLAILQLIGE